MPFKSEKQRRFMWARHPRIARRWAEEGKRKKKKHKRKKKVQFARRRARYRG